MSSPKPIAAPPGPPVATVTGVVGAPPPPPPLVFPSEDARWRGLDALARWMSSLVYYRTMAPGAEPEAFTLPYGVPQPSIFVEMPDNVQSLPFPCIGFLPGRGSYVARSDLGGADPIPVPGDQAAPVKRALVVPYDYSEQVTVEVWGSKIAERRALVAALEVAFGIYEGTTDLRLVVPDYYGLVATYTLRDAERIDDIETARGRRRAHLYVDMVVPVAQVLDVRDLTVLVQGGGLGAAVTADVESMVIDGSMIGGPAEMETHAPDGRPVYSEDPYLYPQPPGYPTPGRPGRGRVRLP